MKGGFPMNDRKRVAIVSDTHMADPDFPPSQKSRFIHFLDEFVRKEVGELILLGDIFELSQGRLTDVYEDCLDILMKFLELANSGIRITYLLGNHDFTLSDVRGFDLIPHPNIIVRLARDIYLPVRKYVAPGGMETREVKGERVLSSAVFRTINGKRAFLAHGHEFNHYFRGNPARFDSVIRAARLLEKVEPTLDDRLLGAMEKLKNGLFGAFYNSGTPGREGISDDELEFRLAARDICKYIVSDDGEIRQRTDSERIDYVFFGHTHLPEGPVVLRDNILADSGREWGIYYNTGAWIIKGKRSDYTVINSDGSVDSLRW
jgi:predicted phosphodiesterase